MKKEHKYHFAILGGDRRQAVIANELVARGHRVRIFGLGEFSSGCTGSEICTNIEKAIEGCDILLLPLPVTRNNLELSLPAMPTEKIALKEILHFAKENCCSVILGGLIPEEMIRMAESEGLSIKDYYRNESLQQKNALPSAEGALMVTMEHTETTVKGMNVLISGYGRIGSILTELFDKLGANVTVAARRDEVLCEIALNGHHALKLGENTEKLKQAVMNSDVVINTVPHVIFTKSILKDLKHGPLYIEVASTPGGIDLSAARDADMKIVFAPSLPGKYSPINAGTYIVETIEEILYERGIIL